MKYRAFYSLSLFAVLLLASPSAATDLDLRLVGTAVADNPVHNLAVLENPSSGKQRTYREGDQLGPGVVKKISLGRVVIATDTGEVVVFMGRPGGAAGQPSRPETGRLTRTEVDSAIPGPEELMQAIRVRPQFQQGKPAGFVIYNIEPESIFSRMGLQDGDVIAGVNGTSFTTTQPNMDFYDALKQDGPVSLEIRRDGDAQQLHFEIH